MDCVVCRRPVADAHYANAWERTRKRYPCCTLACAQAFDPDVHWLPAVLPEPASDAERNRLLAVLRLRLAAGDKASVVVREMLLAGVPTEAIRGALVHGMGKAEAAQKEERLLGLFGLLSGVASGVWRIYQRRDKHDTDDLRSGVADVEAWDAHIRRAH